MKNKFSDLLDKVPEYPFLKVRRMAKELEEREGVEVLDARVGNPDREAPRKIKEKLAEFIRRKNSTYNYPCDAHPQRGIDELIGAIILDYKKKYGKDLKPENIAITNWTKEVIHNLPRLFAPGKILFPEPFYPAYPGAVILSGHKLKTIRTSEKENWLPDFSFKKGDVAFYFCDPNNPTGAVANEDFYFQLLKKMKKENIIGIFDKTYKDFILDEKIKPISITQISELMDYGFEVVSFSKHYNFVGIGLGWLVSSKENIDQWLKFQGHFSQGVSWFKQMAGLSALTDLEVKEEIESFKRELRKRREIFVRGLNELGLKCQAPPATPYLWARVPEGYDDEDFVFNVLLKKAKVSFMPGSYFGKSGKGYFRATLFLPLKKIEEVLKRLEKIRNWH